MLIRSALQLDGVYILTKFCFQSRKIFFFVNNLSTFFSTSYFQAFLQVSIKAHGFFPPPNPTSGKFSSKESHLAPYQAHQLPKHLSFRHINNIPSIYLFLDSEQQLGKSKEFNNQGMKVQVKRAFKRYSFLSQKKETGSA